MRITNSDIIKSGEQELIDAITADLDWGAIEEIFLKEHNLGIEEDIEYKSGDIVAVDNRIAYKLEFEVKVNLSVLLDRKGEYLAVNISNRKKNQEVTDESGFNSGDLSDRPDIMSEKTAENTEPFNEIVGSPLEQVASPVETDNEYPEKNTSEKPDTTVFVDLSDNMDDSMGQKVDEILENLKNTG